MEDIGKIASGGCNSSRGFIEGDTVVHKYHGTTPAVVATSYVAVTLHPDTPPYLEVPADAVIFFEKRRCTTG